MPPTAPLGGQTRAVALLLLACAAFSSLDWLAGAARGAVSPLAVAGAASSSSAVRPPRSAAAAASSSSSPPPGAGAAPPSDGRTYLERYAPSAAAQRRAAGECFRAPPGAPRIAVVGFMKDEAHILREWLAHYFWQGVDAVLLLDNGSADAWRDVAREFPRTHSLLAPRRHKQEEQYNSIATAWLFDNEIAVAIVVDLDEFLFSRDERSLQEVLLEFFFDEEGRAEQDTAALFVPWTIFGSSGLKEQPPNVREHFTWRHNESDSRRGGMPGFINNGKTVSRVSMLDSIKIHRSFTSIGATAVAGDRFEGEQFPGSFAPGEDAKYGPPSLLRRAGPPLQLNHYPVQSWQFFEAVKMKRGAADDQQNEWIRDRNYFIRYDFHEREDTALRDYVRRARANGGTRHDFRCRREEEPGASARLAE
jgi:hypothetical protein